MNMIDAVVIEDSICNNKRLTTFKIRLPKVLLAEFNTHRVFSRNFSSSRAIPSNKTDDLGEFYPIEWGKNQPGMEAKKEHLDEYTIIQANKIWSDCIEYCKNASNELAKLGLHKQWTNRPKDWFLLANGIVTSTEFENFFMLRDHHSAQPEMAFLAKKMKTELEKSNPVERKPVPTNVYNWHLPFISNGEKTAYPITDLLKMSSARCCRVSYNNLDGTIPSFEKDMITFDKLAKDHPKHYSPLEHQATPDLYHINDSIEGDYFYRYLHGNFNGWIQYRKLDEHDMNPASIVFPVDYFKAMLSFAQ